VILKGGFDAVSLPVEAGPGVKAFIGSDRNDWLFPVGSGKTEGAEGVCPQRLNTPGWIFLRTEQRLQARVKFVGVDYAQARREHIASDDGVHHDRGAGYLLRVDPSTWERIDIPISVRQSGNGYRYYDVTTDGTVIFRTVD
jgi:hypothetical protein